MSSELMQGDETVAVVSEHGYSKTVVTSGVPNSIASCVVANKQGQITAMQQPGSAGTQQQSPQQQLLHNPQQISLLQQQLLQQRSIPQQQLLQHQQHVVKQQQPQMLQPQPQQLMQQCMSPQQQQQQSPQQQLSSCAVNEIKQEPQEVMHNNLSPPHQQASPQPHIIRQQQVIQQQQQQQQHPVVHQQRQVVQQQQLEDIKHTEEEIHQLQMELQKVQGQPSPAQRQQPQHRQSPLIGMIQQQQQQIQIQQRKPMANQVQQQQQQQQQQNQHNQVKQPNATFVQSMSGTNIVNMASPANANPSQAITNVTQATMNQHQGNRQFTSQHQAQQAAKTAQNIRQHLAAASQHQRTMVRPSLGYHQVRHPAQRLASPQQPLSQSNVSTQQFSPQGVSVAGNMGTRQPIAATVIKPQSGVPTHAGQQNVPFVGSVQRECNDKVLLLPADSSDGATTPTSLTQTPGRPVSQSPLLTQPAPMSQNAPATQTSIGSDGTEVHTPPLVSSTSGLIISRTPKKVEPETPRCCDCKKQKCFKCVCSNKPNGCEPSCRSKDCHFKTGIGRNQKAQGQVKQKPTATVAPNRSQAQGLNTNVQQLQGPNPASVQAAAGLLSLSQESDTGNNSMGPGGDQCQMGNAQAGFQSPASMASDTAIERQQAAQMLVSMSHGGQSGPASQGSVASPGNMPQQMHGPRMVNPMQGQQQQQMQQGQEHPVPPGQYLRTCLMPPHDSPQAHGDGQNALRTHPTVPRTGLPADIQSLLNQGVAKLGRKTDGKIVIQMQHGHGVDLSKFNNATKIVVGANQQQQQPRSGVVRQNIGVATPRGNISNVHGVRTVRPQQMQQQQTQHPMQMQIQAQQQQFQQHQQQQLQQQQQQNPQQQQMQLQQRQAQQQQIQGITPVAGGIEDDEFDPPGCIVRVPNQQHPSNQQMKATTIRAVGSELESADALAGVDRSTLKIQQEYQLDYEDGSSQVCVWDGAHFKIKGSMLGATGQVRGGGGGTKTAQNRVIKGNATGFNMVSQKGTPTLKILNSQQTTPNNPGRRWVHSSVGKEQLSRSVKRPLHPESPQVENNPQQDINATDPSVTQQQEQPPPEPVLKRPRKATEEGKFAVCGNCGHLSADYDICEGCHKLLPDDPKYYSPNGAKSQRLDKSATPDTALASQAANSARSTVVLMDKNKFYGDNKGEPTKVVVHQFVQGGKKVHTIKGATPVKSVRGALSQRGRGRGKKANKEPETVTILSSDDESAMSPTQGGTEATETQVAIPGQVSSPPPESSPGITINQLQQSRRLKMEDARGQVVLPGTRIVTTGIPNDKNPFNNVYLESRSVRIGSLKGTPHEKVHISPLGVNMKIEYEQNTLDLHINSEEILKIFAHFGQNMPVMFLISTPGCAARIRNYCKMTTASGPYFDPGSKEEPHKRITIIINTITQQQIHKLRDICKVMQDKNGAKVFLKEIESDQANILLVKSTPHFADNIPLAMNALVADYEGNDFEDDDEPYDRSRSPSPPRPIFSGPITRLLMYPAPPATGGISVTNEDLFCLNEGEFLNDVIIDFYLKYVFFEILSEKDRKRTHIFSSFFYRRLTQRSKRNDEDLSLTLAQRRHARVKTWTRHVDLFNKDFIVVPINESAHWYLAVICFPDLRAPEYKKPEANAAAEASAPAENTDSTNSNGLLKLAKDYNDSPSPTSSTSQPSNDAQDEKPMVTDANPKTQEGEDMEKEEEKKEKNCEAASSAEGQATDRSEETAMETDDPADTAEATMNTEHSAEVKKEIKEEPKDESQINMKQACILIFDSLAGPTRGTVIRTLREYIQVEWEVKKKEKNGARVFDRDTFKGGNPKCPQQTNFSDCGIFLLQYVEAFFDTPIKDYSIPMKALANWFSDEKVRGKRDELKLLILSLMRKQNPDLKYDPTKDMVT